MPSNVGSTSLPHPLLISNNFKTLEAWLPPIVFSLTVSLWFISGLVDWFSDRMSAQHFSLFDFLAFSNFPFSALCATLSCWSSVTFPVQLKSPSWGLCQSRLRCFGLLPNIIFVRYFEPTYLFL